MSGTSRLVGSTIPGPFARVFDEDALRAWDASVAILDPEGTILWLNPAWNRFADDNHGRDIHHRFGVGANYFEGIHGPLRDYFVATFDDVLQQRAESPLHTT